MSINKIGVGVTLIALGVGLLPITAAHAEPIVPAVTCDHPDDPAACGEPTTPKPPGKILVPPPPAKPNSPAAALIPPPPDPNPGPPIVPAPE